MEYVLNDGAGGGARLGLIVLATDETLEFDARQLMAGRDVQLLHARIPTQRDITPEVLGRMDAEMPSSAALLPGGLGAGGRSRCDGVTHERCALMLSARPRGAATPPAPFSRQTNARDI